MPIAKKSQPTSDNVKEPVADYEISSELHFLPVYDKHAALDAIFHDPDVKYGLALFAAHSLMIARLLKR